MKDSLFEMLLTLFEKTLAQLKDQTTKVTAEGIQKRNDESSIPQEEAEAETHFFKTAKSESMRIFTPEEQMKLTKPSYQFLMHLRTWRIIAPEVLEVIMNQLLASASRFVSLQETKWTIRNALAENLSTEQLAFLDLVLYQKEDGLSLH